MLDLNDDGAIDVSEIRQCFQTQDFNSIKQQGIPMDEDFWVKLFEDMDVEKTG